MARFRRVDIMLPTGEQTSLLYILRATDAVQRKAGAARYFAHWSFEDKRFENLALNDAQKQHVQEQILAHDLAQGGFDAA